MADEPANMGRPRWAPSLRIDPVHQRGQDEARAQGAVQRREPNVDAIGGDEKVSGRFPCWSVDCRQADGQADEIALALAWRRGDAELDALND